MSVLSGKSLCGGALLLLATVAGGQAFAQATRGPISVTGGASAADDGPFVPYDKSYALVVGIGKYSEYTPLTGAVRDAKAFAQVLRETFDFEVKELIDDAATDKEILNALSKIKKVAGENDRIIVYFAGHGVAEEGASGRAMGYLLPGATKKGEHLTDGIRMGTILDLLGQSKAKHTMFIPDACYSGIAAQYASFSPQIPVTRGPSTGKGHSNLRKQVDLPVQVTMTGGASDEQVIDNYKGYGLFTGILMAALKGAADTTEDGWITHSELKSYLEHHVSDIALSEFGFQQTPRIDPRGEGLFVFKNPTHGKDFFRTVAWNKGALVGVGPLTSKEQAGRGSSYRFDRKGEAVKLTRVNGRGHPVVGGENTAIWEFKKDWAGKLVVLQKNARGHLQRARIFRDDQSKQPRFMEFNGPSGKPLKVYSDQDLGASDAVFGEHYTYDTDGYIERKRYQGLTVDVDPRPKPRPKDGSWGVRYERDKKHRLPLRTYFLGPDGSDAPNNQGVAYEARTYDEHGNITSKSTVGASGPPIAVDGVARSEFKVDEWGNRTELRLLDAAGSLTLGADGYAIARYGYSDRGEIVRRRYFDASDQPTLDNDGVHEVRLTPGALGKTESEAYYGVDGAPVLSKHGYHKMVYTRTERAGWILRKEYLGIDGKPTLNRDGYARVDRGNNERGNLTSEAYFDTSGQLTLNRDHVASWRMTYNGNGAPTSKFFFDANRKPTFHSEGYAGWIQSYDRQQGHLSSSVVLDRTRKPTLSRKGFSKRTYVHDDRGRMVQSKSLDINGKPNSAEPYDVRFQYDDATDLQHRFSFKRVQFRGWTTIEISHDDHGRVQEERVFIEGKEPFDVSTPWGIVTYKYDKYGREIEEVTQDPDGKARKSEIKEYDDRGRLVFDAEFLASGGQRYAKKRKQFDARGDLVAETLVFPKRFADQVDATDVVRWEQTFDARGNRLERRALNKDGQPVEDGWDIEHYGCTVVRWSEYDDRDRVGKVACLDGEGKVLMEASRGSAKGPNPVEVRLKAPSLPWMKALESADAEERFGFKAMRAAMVKEQLNRTPDEKLYGPSLVPDPAVLSAMGEIPMEFFVQPRFWRGPKGRRGTVYGDGPLPVGHEETLSQPFITAQQLTGLRVKPGDKILELKTASGYQAVVLEKMGATVYTVETDVELASRIRAMLSHMGTRKVHLGLAHDCYHGWPKKGPYDAIIATAAYPAIPRELIEQLKVGGRLVAPIGVVPDQWLTFYEKQADGTLKRVEIRTPVKYSMIPRP